MEVNNLLVCSSDHSRFNYPKDTNIKRWDQLFAEKIGYNLINEGIGYSNQQILYDLHYGLENYNVDYAVVGWTNFTNIQIVNLQASFSKFAYQHDRFLTSVINQEITEDMTEILMNNSLQSIQLAKVICRYYDVPLLSFQLKTPVPDVEMENFNLKLARKLTKDVPDGIEQQILPHVKYPESYILQEGNDFIFKHVYQLHMEVDESF